MFDIASVLIGAAVVGAIVVVVILYLQKHGKAPGLSQSVPAFTQAAGALAQDVAIGIKAELAALRGQLDTVLAQSRAQQPPAVPQPPPPTGGLQTAYIDRDDFMKAIGASNFTFAVTLDGKLVHNGAGPAVDYVLKPDGSVARG